MHMPLLKVTLHFSWSSLLIEMSVNAISGAWMVSFSSVFVVTEPFSISIHTSPMPAAFNVCPLISQAN